MSMRRFRVVGMAALVLLGVVTVGAPAQAHDGPCPVADWNTVSPADGATFALGEQFTHVGVQVVDASGVFLVEVFVDNTLLGFREFDPFFLDDAPNSPPLPTSVAGTHTIEWRIWDTQLNVCSHVHTYQVVDPSDPDDDDDGIYDTIDTLPTTPSSAFDDGRTPIPTTGQIVDPNGLSVTVQDAIGPAEGVRVVVTGTGPQKATLEICGNTVRLTAGSDRPYTCASLIVGAGTGEVVVELGGGLTVVTIPTGGSAEITTITEDLFIVDNLGSTDVALTVDGVETTIAAGETQQATAWDFQGFSVPVDDPDVLNVGKAGQAVPLRWRLVHADGTPVTDLAGASVRVSSLPCSDGITGDLVEEVAAGSSGLLNLGEGYYQLNWKSPKAYAQSCKTLHLDLGEGVEREALFRFTK
jgi:hypothetical protein